MRKELVKFTNKEVEYIFDGSFTELPLTHQRDKIIIVTDENLYKYHADKMEGFAVIKLPAGEGFKQQRTVDDIITQLLELQADKNSIIVGVGGGVVTDMAGYAASIYKRGVKLILVPTSILAMVDAAIGGKNGVDVGPFKNMVGTIYQPEQLIFDYSFLHTLPHEEWVNGFAEIIKHACIKDAHFFEMLVGKTLIDFKNDPTLLANLIEKNVAVKTGIVLSDEFETGERKLLNFGHTIGHAIENLYDLPHGHAVSIGMVAAATISEQLSNFPAASKQRLIQLLEQYHLPVHLSFDKEAIWDILLMDKKRENNSMNFILLNSIGDAVVTPIPLVQLKDLIEQCL
ncbi:MAG: 3-dehydroquinate synthase [Chitinophagaceae bacterium]|nr:MAG: 3-dehydroquinate synthase [Chitinophagaceae bacterium]